MIPVAYHIGAMSGKRLPYKRRLAYIYSDGGQWIDPELSQGTPICVSCDILIKNGETSQAASVLAGNDVGGRFQVIDLYGGWHVGIGSSYALAIRPLTPGKVVHLDCIYRDGLQAIYEDGELSVSLNASGSVRVGRKLSLFARFTRNDTGVIYGAKCSLYGMTLWFAENTEGEPYARFIPVMDMDDVPCLYDEIRNLFFYNKGTGEFAYGELPSVGGGV